MADTDTFDLGPFNTRAEADQNCEEQLSLGAISCVVTALPNETFQARVTFPLEPEE